MIKNILGVCSHASIRSIIDALDENMTRKAARDDRRQERKKNASRLSAETAEGVDVAEAYSPARMTETAKELGYKAGFTIDLRNQEGEGTSLDLSSKEGQKKALELVEESKPYLLVVSPPCTWCSVLQKWNFKKTTTEEFKAGMTKAIEHVAFAMVLCKRQLEAGRKFVYEHPASATSWGLSLVNEMFKWKGVQKVSFDFCMAGMQVDGVPAKKRTSILTNSDALVKELLNRQCNTNHEHVLLVGGKAAQCQVYPKEFCVLVCKTVMEEKNKSAGYINFLKVINQVTAQAQDVTKEVEAMEKGSA